jgi:hypothetical protein
MYLETNSLFLQVVLEIANHQRQRVHVLDHGLSAMRFFMVLSEQKANKNPDNVAK